MKLSQFRNPTIRRRLNEAADRWKKEHPTRSFERRESTTISDRLQPVLFFLLFLLPLVPLYFSRDQGIQLALLLPVIAAVVSLHHTRIIWSFLTNRTLYHLPVDNRRLERQIPRSSIGVFFQGIFWAFLYGAFAFGSGISIKWGANSALIYLGLVAFLTLSSVPQLRNLSTYTLYFFGAVTFVYLISEPFQKNIAEFTSFIPWYGALFSLPSLVVFFGTGFLVAWMNRKNWLEVAPWDRTLFYQTYGASTQNLKSSLVSGAILEIPDKPSHPTGVLEKLMWRFLNPKERAIIRTVGGTSSNFLRAWLVTTLLVAGLAWLVSLNLVPNWEPFNFLLTLGVLIIYKVASSKCWTVHWISHCFPKAIEISPHAHAAVFHTFPLGLSTLEKLLWKEGAFRWPLIAFTISLASNPYYETTLGLNTLVVFLYVLPIVTLVDCIMFWYSRSSDWAPSIRQHGLPLTLAHIVVFILLLAIFGMTGIIGFVASNPEPELHLPLFIFSLATALFGNLILRHLVRGYVRNPRRDLMKQG